MMTIFLEMTSSLAIHVTYICLIFNYVIHEEKGILGSSESTFCFTVETLTFHDTLKWILIGYSLLAVVETVDMACRNINQEFVFMKCESKPLLRLIRNFYL